MLDTILAMLSSVDSGLAITLVICLMFLNSSVMAPPSELICLAGGYWASTAEFPWILIALIATLSNLAGTALWYHLGISQRTRAIKSGLRGERRLLDRVFEILTGHGVSYFLNRFEKSGWILVVLLRLVPVARSIVSYGAGRANLSWITFYAGSFMGILAWCATWVWAGHFYGLNPNTRTIFVVLVVFSVASIAAWTVQRKYRF